MALQIAVIGAGPAGYPAALTAARLGAQVTLIEKNQLGGVCLHCGCIPSKSLLDAAHRLDVVRSISRLTQPAAAQAAQQITEQISWPDIQKRQQAVTQKLTLGIAALMRQAKVTVLNGTASFIDEKHLTVSGPAGTQTVAFDKVIIATGTNAFIPPLFQPLGNLLFDNSTIFKLPTLSKVLAIVGGGAIGCEFATLMSALGVTVHLIEMQPRLLPNMDEGLSRVLTQNFQKRGIQLQLGKQVTAARVQDEKAVLQLNDGVEITADCVLAAIGRTCDLTALQPEKAGLHWNRKGLENINPHTLQITDTVYAAGDVTGLSLLAHAGTRQGIVAAQNACGKTAVYHNDLIPNAVYTTPELASVGLTKQQAQQQALSIKSHKVFMLANGRALTMDSAEGFVEILSDATSGKLLGASLACPNASDIVSTFTVALQAGLTVEQLKEVVFAHPTISEAIGEALSR